MATTTSLTVRMRLADQNFGSGLVRAEQSATKFSKQLTKVSGGVGRISEIASSLNAVAMSAGGAESSLGVFASRLSTTTYALTAGTHLVFGMNGAFDALKASMLANPIGIVIAGAATAAGALLAIFRDTSAAVADTRTELEKMLTSTSKWERDFAMALKMGETSAANRKRDNEANAKAMEERARKQKEFENVQNKIDELQDPQAARRNGLIREGFSLDETSALMKKEDDLAKLEKEKAKREERERQLAQARKDLTESLAELERSANEAWLSDNEKKLAMLERLATAAGQQFDREKARQQLEAAAEPERLKKETETAERQLKDAKQKEKELAKLRGTKEVDSPTALLKGSAEAELAQNRAQNQVEKMTDLQKQELAEIKQQRRMLETKLTALAKSRDRYKVVNF